VQLVRPAGGARRVGRVPPHSPMSAMGVATIHARNVSQSAVANTPAATMMASYSLSRLAGSHRSHPASQLWHPAPGLAPGAPTPGYTFPAPGPPGFPPRFSYNSLSICSWGMASPAEVSIRLKPWTRDVRTAKAQTARLLPFRCSIRRHPEVGGPLHGAGTGALTGLRRPRNEHTETQSLENPQTVADARL